ncbi:Na(+)-translocating NADH-quinone reductase subunit C [Gammaproteobacteria bacterium]|nr:Na(+)-translocating NADH-quinone reductase subunit C [Gammaproteobacteria bacterium]
MASNDSIVRTIGVTVGLCLVCSVIVSVAAVSLRPIQVKNQIEDRQRNIYAVAGLDDPSLATADRDARLDARIVDLQSGEYVSDIDPADFDQKEAASDPATSRALSKREDIAGIGRLPQYAEVYLVNDEQGNLERVVLPVSGYGLWSTLYGFISVDADGDTVYRLKYYDQKETPGLGGEVENPRWLNLWPGKDVYDDNGKVHLEVAKGSVEPGSTGADHKIDGLSGATLTSRGVSNMMQFWFGEAGFARYLSKIRQANRETGA